LLNKKILSIILLFSLFGSVAQSQEPVDIWNVETEQKMEDLDIKKDFEKGFRAAKKLVK
jgi:hypothetical protein